MDLNSRRARPRRSTVKVDRSIDDVTSIVKVDRSIDDATPIVKVDRFTGL